MPDALFLECCQAEMSFNRGFVRETFDLRGGCLAVPDAPGLGVTLNDEVVTRYRVA